MFTWPMMCDEMMFAPEPVVDLSTQGNEGQVIRNRSPLAPYLMKQVKLRIPNFRTVGCCYLACQILVMGKLNN